MKNITAQEAKALLDNGKAILIDVREPDEYIAEHIPDSQLIPLSVFTDGCRKIECGDKKIIFHCKAGMRSNKACAIAKDFFDDENLLSLQGGIEAWRSAGYATSSGNDNSTRLSCNISIFRQVQIIVGALIFCFISLGLFIATAFFYIAAVLSLALFLAGVTGWCGLAMILNKMPWNKS